MSVSIWRAVLCHRRREVIERWAKPQRLRLSAAFQSHPHSL
jgi:hypothetical protein